MRSQKHNLDTACVNTVQKKKEYKKTQKSNWLTSMKITINQYSRVCNIKENVKQI